MQTAQEWVEYWKDRVEKAEADLARLKRCLAEAEKQAKEVDEMPPKRASY
jgi:hypothetical protein